MLPIVGGWGELLLILILAFLLLNPEDYNTLLKFLGKLLGKIRFYQYKFEAYIESLTKEEDAQKEKKKDE